MTQKKPPINGFSPPAPCGTLGHNTIEFQWEIPPALSRRRVKSYNLPHKLGFKRNDVSSAHKTRSVGRFCARQRSLLVPLVLLPQPFNNFASRLFICSLSCIRLVFCRILLLRVHTLILNANALMTYSHVGNLLHICEGSEVGVVVTLSPLLFGHDLASCDLPTPSPAPAI
eukprot:2854866-Amphidinium_carterae.1